MKNNSTKQRLFEVMGRMDKKFKPKMNEDFDYQGSMSEDVPQNGDNENEKSAILNSIDRPLNSFVKDLNVTTEYDTGESKSINFKILFDINNLPNGYDAEKAMMVLEDNLNYSDSGGPGAHYSKCRSSIMTNNNMIIVSGYLESGYDV